MVHELARRCVDLGEEGVLESVSLTASVDLVGQRPFRLAPSETDLIPVVRGDDLDRSSSRGLAMSHHRRHSVIVRPGGKRSEVRLRLQLQVVRLAELAANDWHELDVPRQWLAGRPCPRIGPEQTRVASDLLDEPGGTATGILPVDLIVEGLCSGLRLLLDVAQTRVIDLAVVFLLVSLRLQVQSTLQCSLLRAGLLGQDFDVSDQWRPLQLRLAAGAGSGRGSDGVAFVVVFIEGRDDHVVMLPAGEEAGLLNLGGEADRRLERIWRSGQRRTASLARAIVKEQVAA